MEANFEEWKSQNFGQNREVFKCLVFVSPLITWEDENGKTQNFETQIFYSNCSVREVAKSLNRLIGTKNTRWIRDKRAKNCIFARIKDKKLYTEGTVNSKRKQPLSEYYENEGEMLIYCTRAGVKKAKQGGRYHRGKRSVKTRGVGLDGASYEMSLLDWVQQRSDTVARTTMLNQYKLAYPEQRQEQRQFTKVVIPLPTSFDRTAYENSEAQEVLMAHTLMPLYTSVELLDTGKCQDHAELFHNLYQRVIKKDHLTVDNNVDNASLELEEKRFNGYIYNENTNHGHLVKFEIRKVRPEEVTTDGRFRWILYFRDLNKKNSQNDGSYGMWKYLQDALAELEVQVVFPEYHDDMEDNNDDDKENEEMDLDTALEVEDDDWETMMDDMENLTVSGGNNITAPIVEDESGGWDDDYRVEDNLTINGHDYIICNLLEDLRCKSEKHLHDRLASVVTLLQNQMYGAGNINHLQQYFPQLADLALQKVESTRSPPVKRNLTKLQTLMAN